MIDREYSFREHGSIVSDLYSTRGRYHETHLPPKNSTEARIDEIRNKYESPSVRKY